MEKVFKMADSLWKAKLSLLSGAMVFVSSLHWVVSRVSYLFSVSILLLVVFVFITRCFYVILHEEEFVLQHMLWKFWRRKVKYADIEKVVCGGTKKWPYMKVVCKSRGGKVWKYGLNCVAHEDYAELVEALRERGVTVETKGVFLRVE